MFDSRKAPLGLSTVLAVGYNDFFGQRDGGIRLKVGIEQHGFASVQVVDVAGVEKPDRAKIKVFLEVADQPAVEALVLGSLFFGKFAQAGFFKMCVPLLVVVQSEHKAVFFDLVHCSEAGSYFGSARRQEKKGKQRQPGCKVK